MTNLTLFCCSYEKGSEIKFMRAVMCYTRWTSAETRHGDIKAALNVENLKSRPL